MIKQYNNDDTVLLYDQSDIMFKEVSSGVYYTEKDRFGDFDYLNRYVSEREVVSSLRIRNCVSVIGIVGMYANFNLIR